MPKNTDSPHVTSAPHANVESIQVISMQPDLYHAWGTIARRRNGEILSVYSGGREEHVCPFGRTEFMRSNDEGRTWSFPRVILDSPLDNRDCGVLETDLGTLLVSTRTSSTYLSKLNRAEQLASKDQNWSKNKLERWRAAELQTSAAERELLLGSFLIRSTDNGTSWSAPYRCPVSSPHGPIQLSNGRLLYAGKLCNQPTAPSKMSSITGRIGVCESVDDGITWRWLAEIPTRPNDSLDRYDELHAIETAEGQIIAHIRNGSNLTREQMLDGHGETLQSESTDGGKTWSVPHPIGVHGFPSHLMRLRDGRLLISYGHRREPLGNQASVSENHGRTWSEPMIISKDGTSNDLGYPSTVELDDGSLLTVWYEVVNHSPEDLKNNLDRNHGEARSELRAVLRQARWSIR